MYWNYYQSCCWCCFLLYGHKIKVQDIFFWYSTQMLKISNNFLKKMLQNCLKISEQKMKQQMNIVWFMFYIINNFTFIVLLIPDLQHLLFWCLLSWEVSFNAPISFEQDDLNQSRCSVVLIWLKIAHFQKYLRTCKSQKNCFQASF